MTKEVFKLFLTESQIYFLEVLSPISLCLDLFTLCNPNIVI